MESHRLGSGLPARPSEPSRIRRPGLGFGHGYGYGSESGPSSSNVPKSLNRPAKREDVPRSLPKPSSISRPTPTTRATQPQPTTTSSTTTRRPSLPQPISRPSISHQAQSWGSSSTSASARSAANQHGASGSSSSTQSIDNTRPNPNGLRRKKPSLSGDSNTTRNGSSRTDSSSSSAQHKRHGSVEPVFGFHLDRELTCSPAEIQIAEVVDVKKHSRSPVIYPELDRYRNIRRPSDGSDNRIEVPFRLATHDLPPQLQPAYYSLGLVEARLQGSPSHLDRGLIVATPRQLQLHPNRLVCSHLFAVIRIRVGFKALFS
ncbi:hypothetical protein NXS19_002293 [Fusarium pseudograminearum]|nr:hypothetical protein NXS19_002293 [Fusarium pseudograminearum]